MKKQEVLKHAHSRGEVERKNKKVRVLVAMSGGVDSSVVAYMMKQRGFQIIGAFMKNWSDTKDDFGECRWKEDRNMAAKIATKLQIPLITLDFEKQYRKLVISEMFNLYKKGITPNPDIDCNEKIKFPLLRKAARKLGAEFVVTGHYARIKEISTGLERADEKSTYQLLRAKDESKDQSYFLYRLNQEDLKNSLFPIGDYTKKQVREVARKLGFPNFDRKGTVGICFIGKVNMKKFLQKKIKPRKGKILDAGGKQIGIHDGIYYYTIGQRLGPRFGLEIQKNVSNADGPKKQLKRWYVARKYLKKNEIIAAPEGHPILLRKYFFLKSPHWVSKYNAPQRDFNLLSRISVKARIRQVGELLPSKLNYDKKKKKFKVVLSKPITGISEGQAAVLYQGKVCLGGGAISFE